jgi:cation:H+ antiporter
VLADVAWSAAFFISLAGVLIASDRLVTAVEAAGDRYAWPAGMVGLLAAAGADGPEVSAAVIALLAGAHDVSLGVILGSNMFNLAAVLGLPIVLVGSVAVRRRGVALNGGSMILTTLIAVVTVLGVIPAAVGLGLSACVLAAYLFLLLQQGPSDTPFAAASADLGDQVSEEREREREADTEQGFPGGIALLRHGLAATAVIVGGCDVLVHATLFLGPRIGLSSTFTGTFALAALTSLPNVWVAITLARRRRGAVLMSAVCNSNTINVVFGVCVPAQFVALRLATVVRQIDVPALAFLTIVWVVLVWQGRGLGRRGALAIIAGYVLYAGVRLASS